MSARSQASTATAWPLEGGLHRSPALTALGLVAGFTTRTIDEERAGLIRGRLGDGPWLRAGALDLWAANVSQLADAGVRTIELAGLCTRCGGAELWSYRSRGERGPQGTALAVVGRPR